MEVFPIPMKDFIFRNKLFITVVGLIALLVIQYGTSNKRIEPERPMIPSMLNTIIARQNGNSIEYFVKDDPYTVRNFINSNTELKKAEEVTLLPWKYKVLLTNTLIYNKDGIPTIPNDESVCVVYVYNHQLEVDGLMYVTSDNDEYILEWFDSFFDENKNNYPLYVVS